MKPLYNGIGYDKDGNVVGEGNWPNDAEPGCSLLSWLSSFYDEGTIVKVEITQLRKFQD